MWLVPAIAIAALLTSGQAFAQQASEESNTEDTGTFVEKVQRYIKEKRLVERLSPRDGVYARASGLTTGSGMAVGAGYRRHLVDDRLFADASAIISIKNYKAVDLRARWLRAWNDRIEFWTSYRFESFPEEDFFGIGPGASADARTSYKIIGNDISTRGMVHLQPWLTVGADLGYYRPHVSRGLDAALPSIEERFADAQAPGLSNQPGFLHHSLFAEADTRDERGRPTRGGLYRASFSTWDDTTPEQSNFFRRVDADASRFVPIAGKAHVAAFRVGASFVNNSDGNRVPFYFLPYIGGSDTVRGLVEFRYRDENIVFLNAEYRWTVHKYVDVATFFDAGKVGHNWQDITLHRMKTGYGVGARVHTDSHVFFRVDVGTGSGEGTNVFVKFGPSF